MAITKKMRTAFLGLGSNMGDRGYYLQTAIRYLQRHPAIVVERVSGIYETEPWGGVPQEAFWNQGLQLKTTLTPHKLLDVCQSIENALGRKRIIRWGPRTVDIDILLYDNKIVKDERLTIPHPYLEQREFVLAPLREIAPELILPSGQRIAEVFGSGEVMRIKN